MVAAGVVGVLGVVGLSGLADAPADATTATAVPQQMDTKVGTAVGSVTAHADESQTGTAIDPSGAVVFGPANYTGERLYSMPFDIPVADVWGITVHTNVNGPAKTTKPFTWRLYNWRTKKWDKLGDNTELRGDGTWQTLDFFAGNNLADYVQLP
jgi:hypothetical protein